MSEMNNLKDKEMSIHYEDYIPLNEFDPQQIGGVMNDPNRKLIKEHLVSPQRGKYSKFPPHTHNNYKEEFWGGFKTLHKEKFHYNIGFSGLFDDSTYGNTGIGFQMVTGNLTTNRENEIKDIEYSLKKYVGSDCHYDLNEEFKGNLPTGTVLVWYWSQEDNCFVLFTHIPTN